MKLDGALSTAAAMADRFGKSFYVYRFPGWDAEEYGVIAADRGLPETAIVAETLQPSWWPKEKTKKAPVAAQGSLFE